MRQWDRYVVPQNVYLVKYRIRTQTHTVGKQQQWSTASTRNVNFYHTETATQLLYIHWLNGTAYHRQNRPIKMSDSTIKHTHTIKSPAYYIGQQILFPLRWRMFTNGRRIFILVTYVVSYSICYSYFRSLDVQNNAGVIFVICCRVKPILYKVYNKQ